MRPSESGCVQVPKTGTVPLIVVTLAFVVGVGSGTNLAGMILVLHPVSMRHGVIRFHSNVNRRTRELDDWKKQVGRL